MSESVKFDPGIGDLAVNFNDYVNRVYSSILSVNSLKQKSAKFKMFAGAIENKMKNNVAFYKGCLLWAYYIKKENEANPKEISENYFLYLSDEQLENYDYTLQVSFMDNYFDSFERDYMYYMGKKHEIPREWREIISLYGEFLELNKGFTKTKMTSDIILPEKLEAKEFNFDIKQIIDKAISNKDLNVLLELSQKDLI